MSLRSILTVEICLKVNNLNVNNSAKLDQAVHLDIFSRKTIVFAERQKKKKKNSIRSFIFKISIYPNFIRMLLKINLEMCQKVSNINLIKTLN